jgi:hypothetical protein
MKDKCNYYNTKNLNNTLQQNTLEPIYRLAALFARRAKADISARGTKMDNNTRSTKYQIIIYTIWVSLLPIAQYLHKIELN